MALTSRHDKAVDKSSISICKSQAAANRIEIIEFNGSTINNSNNNIGKSMAPPATQAKQGPGLGHSRAEKVPASERKPH